MIFSFQKIDSPHNNGVWLHTNNAEDYLKVYVWLTSTRLMDVVKDRKILLGVSNTVMTVERLIPENPKPVKENCFWSCSTWIIKSFIDSDMTPQFQERYFHFKMNDLKEYSTPPIPEHLVKLYRINNSD